MTAIRPPCGGTIGPPFALPISIPLQQRFAGSGGDAGTIFMPVQSGHMHRNSIYIAEKDKAVQQYLGDGLSALGFDTTVFDSGYPLVTLMDNWPDIFLIDIQLSDVNGLEVCKWLKSHESSWAIPVILLSGDPYLKLLAASAQADDYIERPFILKDVVAHIRECLLAESNKAS